MVPRIFGYPLPLSGTAQSVEFSSDDSTHQIDHDPGLNSPISDTAPSYIEQNPSSSPAPSTDFTVSLESDWTPSVLFEAAEIERRARLLQILTNVRTDNMATSTGNDVDTAFTNFLKEHNSVQLRQRASTQVRSNEWLE